MNYNKQIIESVLKTVWKFVKKEMGKYSTDENISIKINGNTTNNPKFIVNSYCTSYQ
jgi:hypothetical protein